ncbi:hypothetical protein SLEP1_g4151 [Rubroshorea leprosula]|uniref:Thaumatin-like protein 1b n=1 Tax=Rubroshorea leprosula TaxID=152421 RepID=A0AAV5HXF3_9ROSI|nr:hypothetical protein SLEP1_g4151 [Rubroshorea leprosula]
MSTPMAALIQLTLFCFVVSNLFLSGVLATTFTLSNKCEYTVWPGILTNPGVAAISTTGFALQKDETKTINAPAAWAGRFWGRTLCSEDSTGKFSCATGDCGSGKVECSGSGAVPPATLAEFTLNGAGGMDFFDLSLVDGYNLAMQVTPQGGTGNNCTTTSCIGDLNGSCPSELKVTSVDGKESVACKSACLAFQQPQYCCSGAYSTPDVCKPSNYSQIFKNFCPDAYSYAYDDKTSTFTCAHADYLITFCPPLSTSQKSSQEQTTTTSPSINGTGGTGTMTYEGVSSLDGSGASRSTWTHLSGSHAIVGAISITVALWQLL